MELMRKNGVLHVLRDDSPNEDASEAIQNRFKRAEEKARAHIVLNLGDEPATLFTSSLMSGATTKEVWNKLKDAYQKENIQSKLNPRTKLHTVRYNGK